MTSTSIQRYLREDTCTIAKGWGGRVESSKDVEFVEGCVVYHKNPVGPNYVFKNKSGIITGFVNPTKKRAIVKWSNSQVKRHNVSSLSSSAPAKAFLPRKKREYVEMNSKTPDEQSDSDSDSDSGMDEEWMNSLLSEI
jgi:hypothetical protein